VTNVAVVAGILINQNCIQIWTGEMVSANIYREMSVQSIMSDRCFAELMNATNYFLVSI
jgi:hypothetical protein